jgi:hypothetical protein
MKNVKYDKLKVLEEWPGKNRFCCYGYTILPVIYFILRKLMSGPKNDIPMFGFALLSILLVPCKILDFHNKIN